MGQAGALVLPASDAQLIAGPVTAPVMVGLKGVQRSIGCP